MNASSWLRAVLICLLLLLPAACGGGGGTDGGGGDPPDGGDPPPEPLPPLLCTDGATVCGELVPFEPDAGEGYVDLLLPGETPADERYDYVRRDVLMAIQYAAAKVARVAESWTPGNGQPIGIGHTSMADGSTPETLGGLPLFPAGTYEDGLDVQVAYYQVGTPDNAMRAVCPHDDMGTDLFRCTAAPDTLDARRTALFIAALAEHPMHRVIGVDPLIGPVLESALDDLVTEGIVDPGVRAAVVLAYGPGFENFHYQFLYVGFSAP